MPLQHLPAWIQLSAFLLAINAGLMNVLSLISVMHQSISHMSGNASLFALALIQQQYHRVFYLFLIIFCYVLGSAYTGYILGSSHFQLGRRYGIPLSLVSLFTLFCWLFMSQQHPQYALLWASAAMGTQNAMVSHYKGTIIRTTHLSGVLTDIGLALGYLLRGLAVERRRITLHSLIILGFILGGIVASYSYSYLQSDAFLIPVSLSLLLSLAYWLIYFRHTSKYH